MGFKISLELVIYVVDDGLYESPVANVKSLILADVPYQILY
jgi:hypothetical protein